MHMHRHSVCQVAQTTQATAHARLPQAGDTRVSILKHFKDFAPDEAQTAASVLSREAVQAEAEAALRTHTLDTSP